MNKITKDFILSLSKVVTDRGCWLLVNSNRGGTTWVSNRNILIHRIVAYLWHGGFDLFNCSKVEICHKCENDSNHKFNICFNPDHIYVGTKSTNMYDSVKNKTHTQSRKTHCSKGHLFDAVLKRHGKIVGRKCRICMKKSTEKHRKRFQKQREKN